MVEPKLEFKKYLGKGSFGSVSLFKYSKPRTTFYTAVKTTKDKTALDKEFRILSQFKGCSRIIQLYENKLIEHENGKGNMDKYMMLMEYASGGTLRSFIDRSQEKKLHDSLIREFTIMILEGLATIHGHGYVHCDLKPENILVFPKVVYEKGAWRSSYELKISDFGLSKKDGDTKWWHPSKPFAATPIYMSPESISCGETGKGLDLWSLGCVVLEMYTGKSPWWHKNYGLKDIKNSHTPLIPNYLPCDARNFIMTCFALETDERSDALTLLKHSFLCGDANKINEIAERPSKIMSIAKRVGELKIFKKQIRKPRPNLLPVYRYSLVEPSRKYWFIIGSSIWVVFVIVILVCFYF